jgi:hypothetical protein
MSEFVPFNFEGIPGIELSDNGVEATLPFTDVLIRVDLNSGGPPVAVFGRRGPRGGWRPWQAGGDSGELAAQVMVVRRARDLVETLEERWQDWAIANGYERGDA